MYADNEFLIAFSNKLLEIADQTTDTNTEEELRNIAQMAIETCVAKATCKKCGREHIIWHVWK